MKIFRMKYWVLAGVALSSAFMTSCLQEEGKWRDYDPNYKVTASTDAVVMPSGVDNISEITATTTYHGKSFEETYSYYAVDSTIVKVDNSGMLSSLSVGETKLYVIGNESEHVDIVPVVVESFQAELTAGVGSIEMSWNESYIGYGLSISYKKFDDEAYSQITEGLSTVNAYTISDLEEGVEYLVSIGGKTYTISTLSAE